MILECGWITFLSFISHPKITEQYTLRHLLAPQISPATLGPSNLHFICPYVLSFLEPEMLTSGSQGNASLSSWQTPAHNRRNRVCSSSRPSIQTCKYLLFLNPKATVQVRFRPNNLIFHLCLQNNCIRPGQNLSNFRQISILFYFQIFFYRRSYSERLRCGHGFSPSSCDGEILVDPLFFLFHLCRKLFSGDAVSNITNWHKLRWDSIPAVYIFFLDTGASSSGTTRA
jgi:hypothetical protein